MNKPEVLMNKSYLLDIICAGLLTCISSAAVAGTMFVGADVEDFAGGLPCDLPGGGTGVDRLGVVTTSGPTVTGVDIICIDFLLNGMADADGKLLAGTPNANPLNTVAFDGSLISSITAPGIPDGFCCNEEMLFVPQAGGGEKFYHAHFSNSPDAIAGIREIDPDTGAELDYFPYDQVVGMALINGDIWITRWAPKEIGIWDPSTGTFTVQFDLDDIGLGTLGNAGALAWDPVDEILWLGTQSGRITPFNLAGTPLGPSVLPFGEMSQTIDGLTFLGEVTDLDPFEKTITGGPDVDGAGGIDQVVEIVQQSPTTYTFKLAYTGDGSTAVEIEDVVPAEWNVTGLIDHNGVKTAVLGDGEIADGCPGGDGPVVSSENNRKNNHRSATKIVWTPVVSDQECMIEVEITTRTRNKSRGNPNKPNKFAPTSCGALYLNDGDAVVLDLADRWGAPIESAPALCLAAVEDVGGDGIVYDGSGDEDGDGISDIDESCTFGTDPCVPDSDADSDGVPDSVDNCPGTANSEQADEDGDGLGDLCDSCPSDDTNTCLS
ncbi:MAG: thrombospondin type 3 repeat-containing protein [Gammaproteobacteria bacterium]|jgi:hypothetical protein